MQFNTMSQLISRLHEFDAQPVIERYQKDVIDKSPSEIFKFTMGSSIYRFFRHENPKMRYMDWRLREEIDNLAIRLSKIEDRDEYDNLVLYLANTLVEDWGDRNSKGEPSRMSIGSAIKITNLLLKHLVFSKFEYSSRIIRFLHIPWDKYTLSPLRTLLQKEDLYFFKNPLPYSPGMGSVKNLDGYHALLEFIRKANDRAGSNTIDYEFLAWNSRH